MDLSTLEKLIEGGIRAKRLNNIEPIYIVLKEHQIRALGLEDGYLYKGMGIIDINKAIVIEDHNNQKEKEYIL